MTDGEQLVTLEMQRDLAAYRQAIAEDDGQRVSLEGLRRELST